MQVGREDVLLPTMMVGNYPKPRWYTGQAFSDVPVGNFMPDSVSFEAFACDRPGRTYPSVECVSRQVVEFDERFRRALRLTCDFGARGTVLGFAASQVGFRVSRWRDRQADRVLGGFPASDAGGRSA